MKDLRGLKIHCDTQEEKKELLEEATKQGFIWWNTRELPCLWKGSLYQDSFRFYDDKTMTYGVSDCISYKEYKAMSGFTKADLKPCMVVELRNRDIAIIGQCESGLSIDWANGCKRLSINRYDECLNYIDKSKNNFDILGVYGYSNCPYNTTKVTKENRKLLFKRKEEPQTEEMTLAEVCKALGKNIKIVKE